jgi:hypothetical protein
MVVVPAVAAPLLTLCSARLERRAVVTVRGHTEAATRKELLCLTRL